MKSIVHIVSQKNNQRYQLYIQSKPYTLNSVCSFCQSQQATMCHIQTFEENRLLVEAYIPFSNTVPFRMRLHKAAKAKI